MNFYLDVLLDTTISISHFANAERNSLSDEIADQSWDIWIRCGFCDSDDDFESEDGFDSKEDSDSKYGSDFKNDSDSEDDFESKDNFKSDFESHSNVHFTSLFNDDISRWYFQVI